MRTPNHQNYTPKLEWFTFDGVFLVRRHDMWWLQIMVSNNSNFGHFTFLSDYLMRCLFTVLSFRFRLFIENVNVIKYSKHNAEHLTGKIYDRYTILIFFSIMCYNLLMMLQSYFLYGEVTGRYYYSCRLYTRPQVFNHIYDN